MSDGASADKDRAAAYWLGLAEKGQQTAEPLDDSAATLACHLKVALLPLYVAAGNRYTPIPVLVEAAFDVLPWARAALAYLERTAIAPPVPVADARRE